MQVLLHLVPCECAAPPTRRPTVEYHSIEGDRVAGVETGPQIAAQIPVGTPWQRWRTLFNSCNEVPSPEYIWESLLGLSWAKQAASSACGTSREAVEASGFLYLFICIVSSRLRICEACTSKAFNRLQHICRVVHYVSSF